jgi:anti-sigma factor RsiW
MSVVTDIAGGGAHVEEERLGLHFLGELDAAQSDEVHRHLESCGQCRAKADDIVDVLAALALDLDPSGREAEPAVRPARSAAAASGPAAPVRPVAPRPGAARPGSGRPGSTGHGSAGPSSAGHGAAGPGRRPSRTRRLWTTAGLLVLVLVVGGLGLSALLRGADRTGTAIVTAGATASDERSGATASVFVTGEQDGLVVRATFTGLESGRGYVLYAAASDGEARELTRWTSRGGVEDVEGRLPGLEVGGLSFVTVTTSAGSAVLYVRLPRTGPARN